MKKHLLLCTLSLLFTASLSGQACIGGSIETNEAFLYGRFETAMRSVGESGVVSSFFLYNLDAGCNWPAENNEIDLEMTGNSEDLLFTTHYPGPWYYTDTYDVAFNPHEAIHDYAIEWEPGIVRWFVDGQLVNVQDQAFVAGLIHPMRLMMNLWASEVPDWVGPWDPSVMPVESEYDYVRCYDYTPGTGNAGTGNNFTLRWEDDFDELDRSRWTVEEFGGFGGNYCAFEASSVEFADGHLYLKLEAEQSTTETVPVTFSVDASGLGLSPTDVVYLNGGFNDWCGNCNPMTESNGVWSLTISLPPGRHEYLFTKNFWEENGGAPLGSECDYRPCDTYANYGVKISVGSAPIVLDTPCWGECTPCAPTSASQTLAPANRKIIKIFDLLGRETSYQRGQLLFYLFDDGRVEKRLSWE